VNSWNVVLKLAKAHGRGVVGGRERELFELRWLALPS
jgi:hypothetical protein